ncbi:hypothetical protein N658DRAFT_492168 [Parathielavia hyrcaniae]|uniref:U6 snRNA phosphodiesterase n=1 Tax=Parathielavia hyrcaniae TaxID=113614 RepID=A0AAN6T597_9PEZI|nr:hypothetical protein N658DRAFT_492168 [Parathielavia hyrcaniae]
MPLVNYTSDSGTSASDTDTDRPDPPPRKKPRTASPPRHPRPPQPGPKSTSPSGPGPSPNPGPATSTLPPLPPTFHDLYASTVRTTTRDDPSLHQGRTRQIPHVPGNWPTHIYIEWHPSPAAHELLTELVSSLQSHAAGTTITSFLHSDLGAPQPLHISLSRPMALPTDARAPFLRDAEAAVRASGVVAFALACARAEWHRTAESARSFLVLRVQHIDGGASLTTGGGNPNPNPELTEMLRRCNVVVAKYGQPRLYEWAEGDGEGGKEEDEGRRVGEAFHVSIAWSFAEPTEELVKATEQVFGSCSAGKKMRELCIPVEGVKVKVGNAITHVALPHRGSRASEKGAKNLLG